MKIILNVPFKEKDEAKKLGAKWSPGFKKWYIVNPTNLEPFLKWIPEHLKRPYKETL